MAKISRLAGQNIRNLAMRRRMKALASFMSAILIVVLPVFLINAFEDLLKPLSDLNSSQGQHSSLQIPWYYYGLFVLIAFISTMNGIYWWRRANHADQGAKGEEDVAQVMSSLKQEGWQIEYGTWLSAGMGDADIIAVSPQGRAYVIDVKSHRGKVLSDGKRLYRRMGRENYEFEKDFLEQAMKQALHIKKQKKLNFVTPIVAFSDAKVALPSDKIRSVYIVEKARLLLLLRSLG